MKETKYSRKLEQNGRLLIPIKLREEMNLIPGQEYKLYIHQENGHNYICIDCGIPETISIEQAIQVLQANGIKIVQSDS